MLPSGTSFIQSNLSSFNFAIKNITHYLKKEDIANCLSVSKQLMIVFIDHAHPMFFQYRKVLCKAHILGFDFLITNCKKRLSCNQNINKYYCILCGLNYTEKSLPLRVPPELPLRVPPELPLRVPPELPLRVPPELHCKSCSR